MPKAAEARDLRKLTDRDGTPEATSGGRPDPVVLQDAVEFPAP
ncbi:hypothetical protein H4696_009859 [Amycolatopsis lexingtonensis]|uniref:Uncharacterized protein n=1 Tax=Amycolatopsis lexingtonensis TaxID=218822 RepID=A0ABR9IHT6_9PSEU|nr:hypothetical protein [Amycolatopsis lexingtonensis]